MIRKATAITITVELSASGVSWGAGDAQISKDGAAFANTTNLPTELGSTAVYVLALTAAEVNCNWVTLRFTDAAITTKVLTIETTGETTGAVVTDASNSTTTFKTDLTSAVNDFWKDTLITFTTGNLAGQVKRVSGYNGTSKFVTANAAFTEAPANGDLFRLLND